MFHVTRRYQFAASHRLHSPALSDEDNQRVYGRCNHPYGHGHNYVLEVSARGPLDPVAGSAVNTALLDRLVACQVLDPLEHRNLNLDVDWFGPAVPTSENLGIEICRRLKRHWSDVFAGPWPRLEKVRIEETPRNIFEVGADEVE